MRISDWSSDVCSSDLGDYKSRRDFPSLPATSRLSPHLHFGEISPRSIWHALGEHDDPGAETFRSELGWREHGINLVDQMSDYGDRTGRHTFDNFGWRSGPKPARTFLPRPGDGNGSRGVDRAWRDSERKTTR